MTLELNDTQKAHIVSALAQQVELLVAASMRASMFIEGESKRRAQEVHALLDLLSKPGTTIILHQP